MGAAPRSCVRAAVLSAMMSALVSAMLPGCRFPDYGTGHGGGGEAAGGISGGGVSGGDPAGSSGEAGDGGSEPDAGAGAGGAGGMVEPPRPCDQTCVPRAPTGWRGPMALWEDLATAQTPDCPAGFADPKPIDVHQELVAPAGTCTCRCDPAEGQVCDTTLHIYSDQACSPGAACAAVATRPCTSVPTTCTGSQGTMSIDALTISGGSCKSQVTKPDAAKWKYNARLCKTSDVGTCEDAGSVCARAPDVPYSFPLCVMTRIQNGAQVPACPDAYPHQLDAMYEQFDDTRGCTDCLCGAPIGGTCTGKITLSTGNDCLNPSEGDEYVLSSQGNPTPMCQKFDVSPNGLRPTHVLGQYVLSPPGTCSVATKSEPTGEAKESGAVTVVCCRNM